MMLKEIKYHEPVMFEEYVLSFEYRHTPGAGFWFPCDKNGNIDLDKINPASLENLENCLSGTYDVICEGVIDLSYLQEDPPEGKCVCGRTVYLAWDNGHGIDCDCGRIYNRSGQELAPRSQWDDRWSEDSTNPYCIEFGFAGNDY
jgi:hypothetical protein